MFASKADVHKVVGRHSFVMDKPPVRIPGRQIPDAPILGNGDIGVAIAGGADEQVFYLGKSDFWMQAHVGETDEQRRDRLLHQLGRRTGTNVRVLGQVELLSPQLQGASYRQEQDLLRACVTGTFHKAGLGTAVYHSFVCATANVIVTRVTWDGADPLLVKLHLNAGETKQSEVFAYDCGLQDDALWFRYAANSQNVPGRRIVMVGARAFGTAVQAVENRPHFLQSVQLRIERGQTATFVACALSDLDTPRYQLAALETVKALDETGVQRLFASHCAWWEDFWGRSLVQFQDETLEKYYYAGHYVIGSCTRTGKPIPGLNGHWNTVDRPNWTGSYTLNYNYESPFYALYSSNRHDIADSYPDTLLDIIPLGRMFAREHLNVRGVYLPVELGPWGTICSTLFHTQKANALHCCVNLFIRFFITYDKAYAERVWPFLSEVADFWEDYLVWENGRYVVLNDCPHEEITSTNCKNSGLTLALLRNFFTSMLRIIQYCDMDEPRAEKWRHILAHLSELPTCEVNGKSVYAYTESGGKQWWGRGGVGMWIVYPANQIGLSSPEEVRRRALDTFEAHAAWDDYNCFNSYYPTAARLGYDPQTILNKMREQCELHGFANGVIWHGGGGIEDSSGIPSTINEMMLQSYDGTLRFFPVWPRGHAARFDTLRCYGAYLASSAFDGEKVLFVRVLSEKGLPLCMENPFGGPADMYEEGDGFLRLSAALTGQRFQLPTAPGGRYLLVPKGVAPESLL